jgi:cell division protease FtsH
MDDMGGRRIQSGKQWRRHKDVRLNGHNLKRSFIKYLAFFRKHKQSFLATALLTIITVLLFGIFSQFQAPSTNAVPNGVTAVDYSTFVEQVKAGNVLAVTVQGDDVNGLLVNPLGQSSSSTPAALTPDERAAKIAAWTRFMSAGYSVWSNSSMGQSAPNAAHTFYTRLPAAGDSALMPLLRSRHVVIKMIPTAQPSIWFSLLMRFVPIILLVLVLLAILSSRKSGPSVRTMDDRITQLGKSRARRFVRAKENDASQPAPGKPAANSRPGQVSSHAVPRASLEPPVTFADVAGIDEVRIELEEIVQFLRDPERFKRLGARIPRGALLVGSPGTGKTLLAKAVAGEAGVPFFSMSASEFVEIYVGVGASRVRDLFNQARQTSPCVIFLDEIDAVGRKRSMRVTASDEREQTLNQLLVELDGFDPRQAVVVLAATNRLDILDKALLRPGRFDRQVMVPLPDRVGREAILKVHTQRTPLHEEVSLTRLARMTTGMSGADLANLVNEAALYAARRDLDRLTHECFEDALARVQLGILRPLLMSEAERRTIAFHEGGHALVAYHLPEADTVNRVTILPRGQSLGVTQFIAEEDRYNYSRESLMARIAVGLGGRVAEELTFGPERVTTGAENDLQVVTDLARRMVTRWGMSEQVGVVFADYRAEIGGPGLNMRHIDVPARHRALAVDADGQPVLKDDDLSTYQHQFAMVLPTGPNASSTSMAALIDVEVQRILNEGRAIARTLLSEHYAQLTALANALMEREHLCRAEFETLLKTETKS